MDEEGILVDIKCQKLGHSFAHLDELLVGSDLDVRAR